MKKEAKKDTLPILLYIGVYIGLQVLAVILYFMSHPNTEIIPDKFLYNATIAIYIITFIVFALVYRKRLLKDFKRLTIKQLVVTIIIGIIVYEINYGLTSIITRFDVPTANQDFAVALFDDYKILAVIAVCICGPIVEELVYRYSLSTIIKNDIAFLIISSLIFAVIHGIGIATLIYAFLGVCFGLCYLKTDKNVMASSIIHIINNAIAAIMILI